MILQRRNRLRAAVVWMGKGVCARKENRAGLSYMRAVKLYVKASEVCMFTSLKANQVVDENATRETH